MPLLSDLLSPDYVDCSLLDDWADAEVAGITADSREVKPGYVFVAVPGVKADGREFIAKALESGAFALVVPEDYTEHFDEVIVLHSPNTRLALAKMAAKFYQHQPEHIVAITGTDGKTSTAHFYQQIWRLLGHKAASLGTLGVVAGPDVPEITSANTTPGPAQLARVLAELAGHGVEYLAMEASSHGLHQWRMDGARVSVAGFTNITRDHLDYHGTEEAYFEAKLRLFTEVLPKGHVAIVNADDLHFAQIRAAAEKAGRIVKGYGYAGDFLRLVKVIPLPASQIVELEIHHRKALIEVPVIGGFQVMNILCAIGMALETGVKFDDLLPVLSQLSGVPGRMEHVATHPNGAPVFVDYAHTPGGLESVLRHIRPHVKGRLHLVFGCGGDRDKGKRPVMGGIAAQLADVVIVTDDNPRTEDAATIRNEILANCRPAREIGDRREAIVQAVRGLKPDDALIIAGKGHEEEQITGSVAHHFSDREEARKAVEQLQTGGTDVDKIRHT